MARRKDQHPAKVKLARSLRTEQDIAEHTPIFQTDAWEKRRQAKRLKTTKQRHGADAFSNYGKKAKHDPANASKGGKASPTNFKNNPTLASKAGAISKRPPRQVKV